MIGPDYDYMCMGIPNVGDRFVTMPAGTTVITKK